MSLRTVGIVRAIWRHSVKACAGEAIQEAYVDRKGIQGDRGFCLLDESGERFTTIRFPLLTQLSPKWGLVDGAAQVMLHFPDGFVAPLDSHECMKRISNLAGQKVLLKSQRPIEDADISLVCVESIRQISEWLGVQSDERRFRANILLDTWLREPFIEEAWINQSFRIGHAQSGLEVVALERTKRCGVVNLSPDSGEYDKRFLKQIAARRQGFFGIYLKILTPGIIRVGDSVFPM